MQKPNRVLVVDDEPFVREGISLALRSHYRVEAFSSAEAAIESMLSNPPGMVLLDVGLPGMDGIQALEKIKQLTAQTMTISPHRMQGVSMPVLPICALIPRARLMPQVAAIPPASRSNSRYGWNEIGLRRKVNNQMISPPQSCSKNVCQGSISI